MKKITNHYVWVCPKCKEIYDADDWAEHIKKELIKVNIKKDRVEIARIIQVNLPLMNKNKQMVQEVSDCIIAYLIGTLEEHK